MEVGQDSLFFTLDQVFELERFGSLVSKFSGEGDELVEHLCAISKDCFQHLDRVFAFGQVKITMLNGLPCKTRSNQVRMQHWIKSNLLCKTEHRSCNV